MLGAILLQIVLILLNAVFASAETAMISSNSARIEHLAGEGDKGAKRLLSLTSNPSRFLSTVQVAITLAGFLGSAYAADNFAGPLVELLLKTGIPVPSSVLETVCVLLITVLLSYFSIVFGELVPKRVAMKNPDRSALRLAGLLRLVSVLFAPFVWVLEKSTNLTLRLLRMDPEASEDEVTEEEIRMMLESGREKGTLDQADTERIHKIFEFDDRDLASVCTHRRDVVILHEGEPESVWRSILKETRFAYYPICGETADDVRGVLNADRFFRAGGSDFASAVSAATEKPLFVPEHMKTDVLFSKMQDSGVLFGVVLDEYGGMQGVVTFNDLLNCLVGNLRGESAEEIRPAGENCWRIAGSASVEDVVRTLKISPDFRGNDTFGGYVLDLLGEVPENGASPCVETEDLILQVTHAEDRRIVWVTVTKKSGKDPE